MRFLAWLASQNAEVIIRWLTCIGLSLFSPVGWLMERFVFPYLNLSNPSAWPSLMEQLCQLPSDTLWLKVLPGAFICLGLNIAFIMLGHKISRRLAQTLGRII